MSRYIEQRSARSALVSSGIVAGITTLMVKALKQPLKVSLPLGIAGALAVDFWNQKREATSAITDGVDEFRRIAREILDKYEQEELLTADPQGIDDINARYDAERQKIDLDNVPEPDAEVRLLIAMCRWRSGTRRFL